MARLALLAALLVSACGTAQAVSDAGADADPVDRVQFCTDLETFKCARDLAAGRITMAQYNICSGQIDSDCHGFNFPAGCEPSRAAAHACIDAMSDSTRIATLNEDITECSAPTLCGP